MIFALVHLLLRFWKAGAPVELSPHQLALAVRAAAVHLEPRFPLLPSEKQQEFTLLVGSTLSRLLSYLPQDAAVNELTAEDELFKQVATELILEQLWQVQIHRGRSEDELVIFVAGDALETLRLQLFELTQAAFSSLEDLESLARLGEEPTDLDEELRRLLS